jgi:Tfp pilus assembly protein PilF
MYHFELGRIFESQKGIEQAKKEYQRALQLNPGLTRAKEALDKLK